MSHPSVDRAAAAPTKFARLTSSSPAFICGGVRDVEEVPLAGDALRRRGLDRAAGRDLHLQGEGAVSERMAAEQRVRRIAREQPGDRAVAEVEHEARALVRVVQEVRLAAGSHDQHVPEFWLGEQEVASQPQRDRRAAGDVRVLECVGIHAAEPVCDPRRRLPDRIVLPERPVVENDVDLGRVDVLLAEQAPAASTDMSLTCSSGAAMCFPRNPNFWRITCSGMELASETSAALIQFSGR